MPHFGTGHHRGELAVMVPPSRRVCIILNVGVAPAAQRRTLEAAQKVCRLVRQDFIQ